MFIIDCKVGKTESENLDRLEAEMISGGIVADEGNRGDDWHRSSLNSDEDPPHMRFVTVLQINEAYLHLHLDPPNSPHNPTKKQNEGVRQNESKADTKRASVSGQSCVQNDRTPSGLPTVVILTLKGLVHINISPEHAASTESATQTSLKFFSIAGIYQHSEV